MGLGVGAVAGRVKSNLSKVTPRKSGALVRSQRLKKKGALEWEIIEGKFYGRIIRAGLPATKINPILPVRKRALWWPGLPQPVAAVRNHPGIKKNDYFDKAIRASRGDVEKVSKEVAVGLSKKYADLD